MAQLLAQFVFVTILAAPVFTTEWPLMRCSKNDPLINNCMLKAAQHSLPTVMNGIPLFRLPPLEPMKLSDMVLTTGAGPISLEVDLKNAVLVGTSKVRFDSAKYNMTSHRLDLDGFHKDIKLKAKYVMKGKIFFVPINSHGTTEISFRNMQCVHSFVFAPRSRVGLDLQPKQKTTVTVIPDMKSVDLMHMNLMAEGVGSFGNRVLNDLMNSNWRQIYESFKPSIENWLRDVYTKDMDPFFSGFNFNDLIPDQLRNR